MDKSLIKPYANLRGANLRWADLYGADLREANLYGADLRGADLREANLYGADLREANFQWADLRGANLRGANLRGANLRGANLRGANLIGANLIGANLYGATIRQGITLGRSIGHATRGDGHTFFAFKTEENGTFFFAGCRAFLRSEFEQHIERNYPDSVKARATRACLDYLENLETLGR